jgi:hypothetical protein
MNRFRDEPGGCPFIGQVVSGEVTRKIAERIEAELPAMLAARSAAWQTQLRELLAPSIDQALSDPDSARERLERSGRTLVSEWLGGRAAEVHELVLGAVADDIGTPLALCRSPGVRGAELAGRALAEDGAELAGWSAEDVPAAVVPVLDWSVAVVPPRWLSLRLGRDHRRRRLLDALNAAVDDFESRARRAFAPSGCTVGGVAARTGAATDPSRAYLEVLHLLAGRPELVQPRRRFSQ